MNPSDPVFAISLPIGAFHPGLATALKSLRAQSCPVRVAVMDASGDPRTEAALAPYRDWLGYHRSGPDDGQAAAIQEGWDALDGDIYGWLNADDFLYPDSLSRVAARFAADPAVDVVTGTSMMVNGAFHFKGLHAGVHPPGPDLTRANTVSQPSTFVRREALRRVGGLNTSFHYAMDWDLWIRLYKSGATFDFLPECLSGVVLERGTKTAQFNARRAAEIRRIVAANSGPVTVAKSLFGFWLNHRAEFGPFKGLFRALHSRLRTRQDEQALGGGVAIGDRAAREHVLPIVHYGDRPARGIAIDASAVAMVSVCPEEGGNGSLREAQSGELIEHEIAPGKTHYVRLRPAGKSPLKLEAIRIV